MTILLPFGNFPAFAARGIVEVEHGGAGSATSAESEACDLDAAVIRLERGDIVAAFVADDFRRGHGQPGHETGIVIDAEVEWVL